MNNFVKITLGIILFVSLALMPGFFLSTGLTLIAIPNVVMKREGESSLVSWTKNRVKRNENANIMVVGPTGSGKSYTCLRLAKDIDPEFNVDEQVVFGFAEMLRLIKKFNNVIPSKLSEKKYKVIILEEFQIHQNAQNWYDELSKLLNQLLSTYRHQNLILLVNAPFEDMINAQSRRLFHMIIEMKGKNEKKKLSRIRPKLLQYNPKQGKFYEHSLFVITPKGDKHVYVKTPLYVLKIPPKEMVDIYEVKKTAFTNKLNEEIERKLFAREEKDNPTDKANRKPLTDKQREVMEVLYDHTLQQTADILGLGVATVHQHKTAAEKKGWKKEDFTR